MHNVFSTEATQTHYSKNQNQSEVEKSLRIINDYLRWGETLRLRFGVGFCERLFYDASLRVTGGGRFVFCLGALFIFVLAGAACQQEAEPELSAAEVVQQSAVRMNEMAGFHFLITRDGAPAYVDPPDNVVVFRSAEGDYTAPDRARAVVRVLLGFATDVRVITVGDVQWQTNPLTNEWEELPPGGGFDPTQLFDAEIGLQTILAEDMAELQLDERLQGIEGVNGRFHQITGTISGDRLFQMSNGLIGPEPVSAELWIAPDSFELVRAVLTEPEPDFDEPSVWQVDFSQFDEVVLIEPPN